MVGEVAISLHETESSRIARLKTVHGDAGRVLQRPPDPLAAVEVQQQAVGVVHLGTEIVEASSTILAEEKHAGQWRDPEPLDLAPEEKPRFDVDPRLFSQRHAERIGAGYTRPLEQRVDHERAGAG
jgi:hypothetical protein